MPAPTCIADGSLSIARPQLSLGCPPQTFGWQRRARQAKAAPHGSPPFHRSVARTGVTAGWPPARACKAEPAKAGRAQPQAADATRWAPGGHTSSPRGTRKCGTHGPPSTQLKVKKARLSPASVTVARRVRRRRPTRAGDATRTPECLYAPASHRSSTVHNKADGHDTEVKASPVLLTRRRAPRTAAALQYSTSPAPSTAHLRAAA